MSMTVQEGDLLPEVKYLSPVADHSGQDAWAEVSSGVDCEAGLRAESHADAEEREEQRDGEQARGRGAVPFVGNSKEDDDEEKCAYKLLRL